VINVPEPGSLRLLPPLTIGSDEMELAVTVIAESLAAAPGEALGLSH